MDQEFAQLAAKSHHSQPNTLRDGVVSAICAANNITIEQFYDRYAEWIAKEFLGGRLSFETADSAANDIWGHSEHSLSGLAWEVFQAFDEGEFYHSKDPADVDPVVKHTVPMLLELFPDAAQPGT